MVKEGEESHYRELGSKEAVDYQKLANMSTHSANPLVCTIGSIVIDEIIKTQFQTLKCKIINENGPA